jgi:putative endonuclease
LAGRNGGPGRTHPGGDTRTLAREQAKAIAGQLGEDAAARYLEQKGCTVRIRNWRCPAGEIDLIVTDGDHLVFVEVKSRAAGSPYGPVLAMTRKKQQQVRNLALRYLEQAYSGKPPPLQPRFDVVLVVLGRKPEIEHLVNAF